MSKVEEFASKIDTWLFIVLVVTILVSTCAAFFSVRKGGVMSYMSAVIVILIGAALPAWVLLSTKYIISGEELVVRSGPFTWLVPITSISSVQDTRNSRSSPALSLDRLQINYSNGKSIMISPKDKERFRQIIGHK